jgi:anti-anti-sigma factor
MVHVDAQGDTVTLTLDGRFDHRAVREFKQVFTLSPRLWIVDLSRVDYVDSAALGTLLLLRELASDDPRRVHVRGVRGQPKAVLVMAKFDRLFTMIA